mgnify:CR=1 FL=1
MDKKAKKWRMSAHIVFTITLILKAALSSWAIDCLVLTLVCRCLGIGVTIKTATGIWLLTEWAAQYFVKVLRRSREAESNE